MSTHIIVITHGDIGAAHIGALLEMFETLPMPMDNIDLDKDTTYEQIQSMLENAIEQILFDGPMTNIVIVTDLFGSTPCNIAAQFQSDNIKVVCGLNLPMLVRMMNYPNIPIDDLVQKAISGGKDGVVYCYDKKNTND